jgi:hypothetical protein
MISESLSSAEGQSNGKGAEESLVEERWEVSLFMVGGAEVEFTVTLITVDANRNSLNFSHRAVFGISNSHSHCPLSHRLPWRTYK